MVYDTYLQGNRDLTHCPPHDFNDILREKIMPVAPKGMHNIFLADGSTTNANEIAITNAMMHYAKKHRKDFSSLQVLGFEHGSHGQSVATLSCSDKAVNRHNLPTYNWPIAPWPKLKYPLSAHEEANNAEESRCLEETRKLLEQAKANGTDVAAVIIEPVSSYKTMQATPMFFKQLRKMTKELGVTFIVDETRTGFGQTGKMWAHEHWYLQDYNGGVPDIVTFGGKAGISGMFSTREHRVDSTCSAFTQVVDMVKLINYGIVWKEIQHKQLLGMVNDTSTFLKIELGHVARDRGDNLVSNIRGSGTFLGFDVENEKSADSI